jgi:hypothetical protein
MQGCYFSLPSSYPIIRRTRGFSLLSWIRRGAILSWCRYADVCFPYVQSSCSILTL